MCNQLVVGPNPTPRAEKVFQAKAFSFIIILMQATIYKINAQEIITNLRDDADESVAAEIFKLREYRMAEDFISNLSLPIFDVGAHAGFFTLYARALNSEIPIIALEPEPQNFKTLENNVKANDLKKVTLIKGALAKESGKRELVLSEDNHNHKLKTSSKEKKIITVQGFDFAYFKKLAPSGFGLIKMDIEGGEYEVFASFKPGDFANIEAIVMEYHDLPNHNHKEIEQILRENGFGVQTFPSKFDKTMGFFWAVNKRKRIWHPTRRGVWWIEVNSAVYKHWHVHIPVDLQVT